MAYAGHNTAQRNLGVSLRLAILKIDWQIYQYRLAVSQGQSNLYHICAIDLGDSGPGRYILAYIDKGLANPTLKWRTDSSASQIQFRFFHISACRCQRGYGSIELGLTQK